MKINPNILISNLSLTLDASDMESTPKRIMVYGGKTNNDRQLLTTHHVKTSRAVVKLLDKQEKVGFSLSSGLEFQFLSKMEFFETSSS